MGSQVNVAQKLLESLLTLRPEETREDIGALVRLHQVRDSLTVFENGWNFLYDDRNKTSLPDRSTWLLRQILDNECLRDYFTLRGLDAELKWRANVVQDFRDRVNRFLEHIRLLYISHQASLPKEQISSA